MQQRTTDKKNDIIKKFKTRAFFKTWEKGESLFTKQKTKDNITFFKKSDSLSILAEGVITEKEEQFYPSLYYSLKSDSVEVFNCTCNYDKKGPCEHVICAFLIMLEKYFPHEDNSIRLSIFKNEKLVSFFKNTLKDYSDEFSLYISFKLKVKENDKIYISDITLRNYFNSIRYKILQNQNRFFNYSETKLPFIMILEKDNYKIESLSKDFINILKNYLEYGNFSKIDSDYNLEIPDFMLPIFMPFFPQMCSNYLHGEISPEIFISEKEDYFVLEIKNIQNWYPINREYICYKTDNENIKLIKIPDYENIVNIFKVYSETKNKIIFPKNSKDVGTIIFNLRKYFNVKFSDEVIKNYYFPEKIQSGAFVEFSDDYYFIKPKFLYDGLKVENIQKEIISDRLYEYNLSCNEKLFFKCLTKDKFSKEECYIFTTQNKAYNFFTEQSKKLFYDGKLLYSDDSKEIKYIEAEIFLNISKEKDMLKINISSDVLTSNEILETFHALFYLSGFSKYISLRNKSILYFKETDLRILKELFTTLKFTDQEILSGTFYRDIVYDFFLNNYSINNLNMKDYIANYAPEYHFLRKYQYYGTNWLLNMKRKGVGGILADGPKLGKKMQLLAFLEIQNRKNQLPNLIIVHKEDIESWKNNIEGFYKNLKYKIIDKNLSDEKELSDISSGEIIITTYSFFEKEYSIFEDIYFENVIFGNFYSAKLPSESFYKAIKKINRKTAYASISSPIEVDLKEIWLVFSIVLPDYLINLEKFLSKYYNYKKKSVPVITPFILRRTKSEVIEELSNIVNTEIKFSLTPKNRRIYSAIFNNYIYEIKNNLDLEKDDILEMFQELKNACYFTLQETLNDKKISSFEKNTLFYNLLKILFNNSYKVIVVYNFNGITAHKGSAPGFKNTHIFISEEMNEEEINDKFSAFNSKSLGALFVSSKIKHLPCEFPKTDVIIFLDQWYYSNLTNYIDFSPENKIIIYNFFAENTIEEKIYNLRKNGFKINDTDFSKEEILQILK